MRATLISTRPMFGAALALATDSSILSAPLDPHRPSTSRRPKGHRRDFACAAAMGMEIDHARYHDLAAGVDRLRRAPRIWARPQRYAPGRSPRRGSRRFPRRVDHAAAAESMSYVLRCVRSRYAPLKARRSPQPRLRIAAGSSWSPPGLSFAVRRHHHAKKRRAYDCEQDARSQTAPDESPP